MRLVCPECLGTLEPGETKAICQTHGGEYKLLFVRSALPPELAAAPVMGSAASQLVSPPAIGPLENNSPAYVLEPGAACVRHTNLEARFACCRCGSPICDTCAFPEGPGLAFCPDCVMRRTSAADVPPPPLTSSQPVQPPIPAGAHCVQHPNIAATSQCKACGAYMCSTCDFVLPDNVHICPACAAAPRTELSRKRKNLVIISFVLAAWATLGMVALFAGVFATQSREAEQLIGFVLILFVLGPAATGLGLAISARERRLPNPPAIAIAIVWNALLVASFLLLCIIGIMRQ